jgi:hypothetical protein
MILDETVVNRLILLKNSKKILTGIQSSFIGDAGRTILFVVLAADVHLRPGPDGGARLRLEHIRIFIERRRRTFF